MHDNHQKTLQVHVDSDWAGDLPGRNSTTEVIIRSGKHLLRHMSCLQTLVALSSGEAEYYALLREERAQAWVFNQITKTGRLIFQYKSTVTVQQRGVSQEDVELEDD